MKQSWLQSPSLLARLCICLVCFYFSAAPWGRGADLVLPANVAACAKKPGFEKTGESALEILRRNKIEGRLGYILQQRGTTSVAQNAKASIGWIISVDGRDGAAARKILAAAARQGLPIVIVPDSTPKADPSADQGFCRCM